MGNHFPNASGVGGFIAGIGKRSLQCSKNQTVKLLPRLLGNRGMICNFVEREVAVVHLEPMHSKQPLNLPIS